MVPLSRRKHADLAAEGYDPLSPPRPRPGPAAPVTVRRFAAWVAQTDGPRTAALVVVELVRGLSPAAIVWVARYGFQDAVGVFRGATPVGALLYWVAAWAGLTLLEQAAWPVIQIVVERVRQEMEDSLQLRLQRKAAALRLEVFERADFYDILSRAREATSPGFFLNVLLSFLNVPGAVATIVAMAAVLGRWSPWLLAATIVAALPDPLAHILQSRASFLLERKQTARARLRGYLAGLLTSREHAKEVRTFGLAPWLIGRWRDLYWSVADETFAQQRAQSLAGAGAAALGAIGLAGGLGFAAWGLVGGHLQGGQFAATLLALQAVQGAMGQVTHALGRYVGDKVLHLADLFVYLDLGPEETAGTASPAGPGIGEITLDGVSFRYPQRAEPALRDIRCAVREGERVALVGDKSAGTQWNHAANAAA
ncbi:MAG TPA: ABC transporter ATP-binding protein [Bacillota bacterium]|nr:ABC transporter ATP-binding protein [Bacillota bacterium]